MSTDLEAVAELIAKRLKEEGLLRVAPEHPAVRFYEDARGALWISRDGGKTLFWTEGDNAADPISRLEGKFGPFREVTA